MRNVDLANSEMLDDLSRKILHALQINGRAPFSLIGQVVGVSEQTVARRYRGLKSAGVVRVVGVVDPNVLGQLDWMVRITCRPNASAALGGALARRDDVSWVSLTGAGNEIVASLRARTQDARDELLLRRLPKTEQVLNLSAVIVMHRFTGRYDDDWSAYTGELGDEAVAALSRPGLPSANGRSTSEVLLPEDRTTDRGAGPRRPRRRSQPWPPRPAGPMDAPAGASMRWSTAVLSTSMSICPWKLSGSRCWRCSGSPLIRNISTHSAPHLSRRTK